MSLFRRLVTSISKSGSPKLQGDVTLSAGSNVTLTQTGNDISIASTGGGGGGVSIGDTVTSGTQYSVLFIDPAATLAQNNTEFNFNNSIYSLGLGQLASQIKINSVDNTSKLMSDVAAANSIGLFSLAHYSDATTPSVVAMSKSRGTFASPTIVQLGDVISGLSSYAYTGDAGVGYQKITDIVSSVASTGTVSTTSMPSQMQLKVNDDLSVVPEPVASLYFENGYEVLEAENIFKSKNITVEPQDLGDSNLSLIYDYATTNYFQNPSAEVSASPTWVARTSTTITRVNTEAYSGSWSIEVVTTSSTGGVQITAPSLPSGNKVASVYLKAATTEMNVRVYLTGASNPPILKIYPDRWTRVSRSTTQTGTVTLEILTNTGAGTFYADAAMLELNDSIYPSTYFDGDTATPALGYEWTGTPHSSTSTRTAGLKTIAPLNNSAVSPFVLTKDGKLLSSKFDFVVEKENNDTSNDAGDPGFKITGSIITNRYATGFENGIFKVENTADGIAAIFNSNTLTDTVVSINGPEVTTGSVISVAAPSDLTNFTGYYLRFFDKSNNDMFTVKRDVLEYGNKVFGYSKSVRFHNSGTTDQSVLSTYSGTANYTFNSAIVTKSTGPDFDTFFSVGDTITLSQVAAGKIVVAVTATQLTLNTVITEFVTVFGGTIKKYGTSSYGPAKLYLEGPRGNNVGLGSGGPTNCLFTTEADLLRFKQAPFVTGTGTIAFTSGSNTINFSNTFFTSFQPRFIHVPSQSGLPNGLPVFQVIQRITNTQWRMDTNSPVTFTTGSGLWAYQTAQTFDNPTDKNDGLSIQKTLYTEANTVTIATNNETSFFSTPPTIRASTLATNRPLRVKIFGAVVTGGQNRNATFRVYLGPTAIFTSIQKELQDIGTGAKTFYYEIEILICPDGSESAQKTFFKFQSNQNITNSEDRLLIGTGTSTIQTNADHVLDVTVQSTNVPVYTALYKTVEVL